MIARAVVFVGEGDFRGGQQGRLTFETDSCQPLQARARTTRQPPVIVDLAQSKKNLRAIELSAECATFSVFYIVEA